MLFDLADRHPRVAFCHVERRQERRPNGYPKEINTLGDHLQKRRLDLGLEWKDVAEQIGVDATTVALWSRGRTQPDLRLLPAVIRFLGYDPRPPAEDIGAALKRYRQARGMSQEDLAGQFGCRSEHVGQVGKSRADA